MSEHLPQMVTELLRRLRRFGKELECLSVDCMLSGDQCRNNLAAVSLICILFNIEKAPHHIMKISRNHCFAYSVVPWFLLALLVEAPRKNYACWAALMKLQARGSLHGMSFTMFIGITFPFFGGLLGFFGSVLASCGLPFTGLGSSVCRGPLTGCALCWGRA
ncbi:hypothetical protein Droror1_Dr00004500 [Drosera rotundifolia]